MLYTTQRRRSKNGLENEENVFLRPKIKSEI